MTSIIDQKHMKLPTYSPFKNLVELARYRASSHQDAVGYSYLQDGENLSDQLTYGELDTYARAIGATLQKSCSPGDRVLLLYPPGLEFIGAFFGCFYAGCLAIPAYPPRRNRHDTRLESIVLDATPALVLSTDSILDTCGKGEGVNEALLSIPWVATDSIAGVDAKLWRQFIPDPDSIAFIQYTSGSTSQPKGVCVSHFNLLHTLEDLVRGCDSGSESVMVTWLPIHHDLGLIYGVMQPIYRGFPCYLMPPASFLQRPLRWLEAISRFAGTHSAAPNFAFDLCVRAAEKEYAEELDLSSLRAVLNAAEPIRAGSIDAFLARFTSAGFNRTAMKGGYGLAETTLKVCMVPADADTPAWSFDSGALENNRVVPCDSATESRILVGCGRSESDTDYIIVNPQTCRRCAQNEIGEIWVRGLTIAQGYFNRTEETQATFNAVLADSGEGPFLRTGDLGFIFRDNLFVTGRIKEMIIIHGMNHYPHDIELTAEKACPELRSGCGAAFSIDIDGQERLVVVYELERRYLRTPDMHQQIMERMREAVVEEHGISVHTVCLLRTNTILKTTSGKIQRQASRRLFLENELHIVATFGEDEVDHSSSRSAQTVIRSPDAAQLRAMLFDTVAFHLKKKATDLDPREPLAHYGLDSVAAVAITGEIERFTGETCHPTLLYECTTLTALEEYLLGQTSTSAHKDPAGARICQRNDDTSASAIAVVGMGCRFPGAEGPEEFWNLLESGVIVTREIPASRWNVDEYYAKEDSPGRMNTRWGGFLDNIDQFDAEFFSIAPREADYMDPQQRILLEVSWEALEHGGIPPFSLRGSDGGVFVGISGHDYLQLQAEDINAISAYTGTGGAHAVAANRLSYFLDLHGPSLAVDTACSSSLVAVHQAVTSLRNGDCSIALASGVNAILTPHLTVGLSKAQMMSDDGSCKAFDAGANGYVRGEGCGVVVLKRLQDALADGNRVLAVIRGTAVRQDGKSNGLTAPNRQAQETVIRAALQDAKLAPSAVSFIEAHGTGTVLGDPIEVEAIKNVYADRKFDNPCIIGSVKANIGHLESAAGMAGLIKAILTLNNGLIPGNSRLKTLNPLIDLADTPLIISPDSVPWPDIDRPRAAAISSFGFGGTIAHTVVSEFPSELPPVSVSPHHEICTLSARSVPALQEMAKELAYHIRNAEKPDLANTSFTLNQGREHFECRLAIVAATSEELGRKLEDVRLDDILVTDSRIEPSCDVVFLFSGQGTRLGGVARELLHSEPVFQACIKRCDDIISKELNFSASEIIEQSVEFGEQGLPTHIQPVLFALQYALARLWRSWGIVPAAVIGHSLGEYAAACTAGIMEVEDALKLVIHRARLAEALPEWGAMAAIFMDRDRVERYLAGSGCVIAAINGPEHIIISGREPAIESVMEACKAQGVHTVKLKVTHGFHSPCVDPMLDEVEKYAQAVTFNEPQIQMFSTLTGKRVGKEITTSSYWRRHLREPVQFLKAMNCLYEEVATDHSETAILEIGPSSVLISMARRSAGKNKPVWLPSLGKGTDDRRTILDGLARLYVLGHQIDWNGYYGERVCRRVSLPTYPFQRRHHWLKRGEIRRPATAVEHPLLGNRLHLAQSDGRIVWENTLSVSDLPYLNEHVVNSVVVYPGVAFSEMVMYAARSFGMLEEIDITDLEVSSPLTFTDTERYCLQTIITSQNDGFSCSIYSIEEAKKGTGNWRQHVRCRVTSAAYSGRVVSIADIESSCQKEIEGGDFYQYWKTRGNRWGQSFQAIQRLRIGNDKLVAWLSETAEVARDAGKYVIHPALLDGCVQTMAAGAEGVGAFVGNRVGRMHITRAPKGKIIVFAQWRAGNARQLIGDVTVTDEEGRVILVVEDLTFTFLEKARDEAWRKWLYLEEWEPFVLPVAQQNGTAATWLTAGHQCRMATAFSDRMQGMGHNVHRVELKNDLSVGDRADQIQGVVLFVPELKGAFNADEILSAVGDQMVQVAQTISAISANPAAKRARLWLVTGNVWTEDKESVPQPAAAIWGLATAIAAEYPNNWGGVIDIEKGADALASATSLAQAVTNLTKCDKLRIGQEVKTPRLRPINIPAEAEPLSIQRDGAYLITGGYGRLGQAVAHWLCEQGARHIILLGRSGPPGEWQTTDDRAEQKDDPNLFRRLADYGVQITNVALDISDVNQLQRWVDTYKRDGNPQIRGIFHSAGVVTKEPIAEFSRESCLAAVSAKVGGIMALEQVLNLHSMDCIVLFSSAATIIHSPFLGAYAAANAFLDSYAHKRVAQGYPVVSIDWSIFTDGGMAALAEQAGDAKFSRTLQPLHSNEGMQIMGRLLGSDAGRVAVLPVDWEQWRRAYPSQAELIYWEHIVEGNSGQKREDVSLPERETLLTVGREEQQHLLIDLLTQLVARALGAGEEKVDRNRPLTALGIDSLMALEIRASLEKAYGVTLPVVKIMSGPSIEQLAQSFAELLTEPSTIVAAVPAAEVDNQNETGFFPLSFNQYSQWLLSGMAPDVSAYHVSFSARMTRKLEVGVLQQSLEILVQRHATLRTTYTVYNGEISQEIHGSGKIFLEQTDATGWTEDELQHQAKIAYARPFDLSSGPLIRTHLFTRSPEDHVLLLVVHHIACDGWSLWLLLEELSALYAAKGDPVSAHLPELSANYLAFTRRQLEKWSTNEKLTAGREFWAGRLADRPFVLDLATDYPRPVSLSLAGASIPFSLSSELTHKLKKMAGEHNTTMFTVLMAAYQLLLYRITSQSQILVGSPTAGRTEAEFSRTVGHFVNMIVIRGDLSLNPTWDEFIETMRQEIIDSFEHQDFPFHLLVETLQPERLPGRTPVFQVDFTYQRAHTNGELIDFMGGTGNDTRLHWGELELAPFVVPQQEGQFDLSLEMAEGAESLFGFLKYNTNLFKPETISNLAQSFCKILEAVCAAPEQRVDDIPLLDERQYRQVMTWATTTSRDLPDRCLHELFAEQVTSIPDERAVVCGKQSLTYRQLDERSSLLASRLRGLGVGVESIVAVALDRSVDLIVAILAILKAGGGYLPLDLSHPASRRKSMLTDSGATVLISKGDTDGTVDTGLTVLDPTSLEMRGDHLQKDVTVRPENLAYVIYTSGSTGKPKGVMIEHRSVVNLITGLYEAIYSRYEGIQQVSLFASTVFDASVQQIFAALCGGHTLHVLTEECRRDSERLLEYWHRENVTIADATPTLLQMLLDAGIAVKEGLALKHLIVGGEPLSRELVRRLDTDSGDTIALTNIYGPTECCVDVTAMDLELTNLPDFSVMPIGKPMINIQAHILDRMRKPVVPGMPGELYIGGPNVGRGYVNRDDLTGASFVENPFEPGTRLYKTGDIVRYLPEGVIGFLGRSDKQIKIRGYRIEPGEIEYRLRNCPGVREAVVVVREDIPGDRRLVAYLVMADEAAHPGEIRRNLIDDLPEYMVPSLFVPIPALPLSSSGKLDRGRLPPPGADSVLSSRTSAQPRSEFEREVAEIWKHVIGLTEVGIHDNFFDLGGNSLLLTKVQIRLQATLGRPVAITDLFRFPTIHALAEFYAEDGESESISTEQPDKRLHLKRRGARLGKVRRALRAGATETEE